MEGQPGQKNQTLEEPEGSPEGAGGTRLCSAHRASTKQEAIAWSWLSLLPMRCPRSISAGAGGLGWRPRSQVLGRKGTNEGRFQCKEQV